MRRRNAVPWLLLALVAAYTARSMLRGDGGAGEPGPDPRPGTTIQATVQRVVDGDTIVVTLPNDATDRVRYIGMDTPESVKPGTPVQCFAEKASAFNHSLVDGRRVKLVLDAEPQDRYGRMLAYVYRQPDGLFVNEELVRRGYARPLTIPPNVRFEGDILRLSQQAREAGRGLWSRC